MKSPTHEEAMAAHLKGLIKSWCECAKCDEQTTQKVVSHGLGIFWLMVQQLANEEE